MSYYSSALYAIAQNMVANCLDYADSNELPKDMLLVCYEDGIWVTQPTESCSMREWIKIELITSATW